jgi:hypothetical protein
MIRAIGRTGSARLDTWGREKPPPPQPKKWPPPALSRARARGCEDWLAILGRRAAINKAPRGEVSDAGQSCARCDATAR